MKQPTYKQLAIILAMAATIYISTFIYCFYSIKIKGNDGPRAPLLRQVERSNRLLGMTRAQVMKSLGRPDQTDTRATELFYRIGSDGVIDDIWLVVRFENDRVINVRVQSD